MTTTTTEPAVSFVIHTAESAPEASGETLRELAAALGFLPNLAATMAGSPTLLAAFAMLRDLVARGSFSGAEREAISLGTSFQNDCSYCMAAHSTFAEMQGMPAAALAALRAGEDPIDQPRLGALARFARRVVERRGFLSDGDLGDLLAAGFSPAQLLEALAVIGMTLLANYTHNIAGTPVDEAFGRHRWFATGDSA